MLCLCVRVYETISWPHGGLINCYCGVHPSKNLTPSIQTYQSCFMWAPSFPLSAERERQNCSFTDQTQLQQNVFKTIKEKFKYSPKSQWLEYSVKANLLIYEHSLEIKEKKCLGRGWSQWVINKEPNQGWVSLHTLKDFIMMQDKEIFDAMNKEKKKVHGGFVLYLCLIIVLLRNTTSLEL